MNTTVNNYNFPYITDTTLLPKYNEGASLFLSGNHINEVCNFLSKELTHAPNIVNVRVSSSLQNKALSLHHDNIRLNPDYAYRNGEEHIIGPCFTQFYDVICYINVTDDSPSLAIAFTVRSHGAYQEDSFTVTSELHINHCFQFDNEYPDIDELRDYINTVIITKLAQ